MTRHNGHWILLIAAVTAALTLTNRLEPLELPAVDARLRMQTYPSRPSDVVVLGITRSSLDALGSWPWPRSRMAEVINRLDDAGATTICLDVFFAQSTDPVEDQALIRALANAKSVILPEFSPRPPVDVGDAYHSPALTHNVATLRQAAVGVGHINVVPEQDGVLRAFPIELRTPAGPVSASAIAAVNHYTGGAIDLQARTLHGAPLPTRPNGLLPINYYGGESVIPVYSIDAFLRGDLHPRLFRNRLVFVGQTTHGLPNADLVQTPFGPRYGVEVLGLIADNLLSGDLIRSQSRTSALITLAILALLTIMVVRWAPHRWIYAYFGAALLALATVAVVAFAAHQLLIQVAPPATFLVASLALCTVTSLRAYRRQASYRDVQLEKLLATSAVSANQLNPDTLTDEIARTFAETIGAEITTLSLVDEHGALALQTTRATPDAANLDAAAVAQAAADRLADRIRVLQIADLPESLHTPELRQFLALPLRTHGELIGLVCLINKRPTRFSTERRFEGDALTLLSILGQQTAMSLSNARLITNLKRALVDLEAAQDELVRMEKLSAIGNVAAMIVHDALNPVSCIRGYAGMLGMMADDPEAVKSTADVILQQVDRVTAMMREIIDYSKGELKLDVQPTTVDAVVEQVRLLIEPVVQERRLSLQIDLDYSDAVELDRERMIRVLANLVKNAAEAMYDRGSVITITAKRDQDELVLAVADDGPGIPADRLDTLFDPFVTHGKKHGTGLGLAIARKIVEEHSGVISVASTVDVGSTFIIRLPIAIAI